MFRITGAAAVALLGWMVYVVVVDHQPLPIAYYVDNNCIAFVNPPDENGHHSDMGCHQRRGRAYTVMHVDPSQREEILKLHAN